MSITSKVCVEFQTGEINSEYGSGKCYIFHSPKSVGLRAGRRESYLSQAVQECPELAVKGTNYTHLARNDVRREIGGYVYQSVWQLEDGEVFKLFAKARHGGWNARERTGCLYIQMRADGAMNKVGIKVPNGIPDSVFPVWNTVGRFDVLTLEEAEALGVSVLDIGRVHCSPSSVEALFTVEQLEEEFRTKAKVVLKRVGSRVMPVTVRKRSLDI